jgi:hypothetical protein
VAIHLLETVTEGRMTERSMTEDRKTERFLTERIVYFLNTVHSYKIWKNTVTMKYKYIGVV